MRTTPVNKKLNMMLAKGTAEELAKKYNISYEQAWNLFKKSRTFKVVLNASDEFYQDVPANVLDLWENERLFGAIIDSENRAYGALKSQQLGSV
ncbi:MAG: hypothetical protein HDS11_02610 [Bacteroides sp.]|nr:hypothetical protein [Bacteroides sp.]